MYSFKTSLPETYEMLRNRSHMKTWPVPLARSWQSSARRIRPFSSFQRHSPAPQGISGRQPSASGIHQTSTKSQNIVSSQSSNAARPAKHAKQQGCKAKLSKAKSSHCLFLRIHSLAARGNSGRQPCAPGFHQISTRPKAATAANFKQE